MGGDRSTAEPGNVSGQAGGPRNVIAFPGPRKLSPLWTDEEKHAAEAMRDAGFTALEIANVLGRQAGAVYAWAKKSGVSMQGDKAKETRQWLAQGRSLMREVTAFGVIWRDPRLEL